MANPAINLSSLPPEVVAQLVELARLKEKESAKHKVSCEVGKAGGLVIKGMGGRYGCLNMWADQFDRLVENLDVIKAFVEANRGRFSTK